MSSAAKPQSVLEQFHLFFLVLFYTLFAWLQWWSGVSPRLIRGSEAWCSQCHNLKPSDSHLLGPNLVGVFNQQAGTVQGYGRNSKAMLAAGQDGMFWTRENLAEFLTDGQKFIPNNLMNQQTDLSDPVRLNIVIDLLEIRICQYCRFGCI